MPLPRLVVLVATVPPAVSSIGACGDAAPNTSADKKKRNAARLPAPVRVENAFLTGLVLCLDRLRLPLRYKLKVYWVLLVVY